MANLDGTGPNGQGPKTGKGRGKCEGSSSQGGLGRGMGMRNGMGRCCGRGNFQAPSLDEEAKFLRERLDCIEKQKQNEAKK